MNRESGDQKGIAASSTPGTTSVLLESRRRTDNVYLLPVSEINAMPDSSGETAKLWRSVFSGSIRDKFKDLRSPSLFVHKRKKTRLIINKNTEIACHNTSLRCRLTFSWSGS